MLAKLYDVVKETHQRECRLHFTINHQSNTLIKDHNT